MDLDQIVRALADVADRRAGIEADLAELGDMRRAGQRERAQGLRTALTKLDNEEQRLNTQVETHRAAVMVRADAAGGRATERGDDTGRTDVPPVVDTRRSGPAGEALGVLERSRALSDELRHHAGALVVSDETGEAARTMAAAADPDYATAFGKVARDPQNGHRGFTTNELAAWQRAEVHARSLNLTGGASMVPTHLDPTIMLSSDGSVDPMRQIARVVTITGTTEWNGVSSAGVTTRWGAEESEANDDSPTLSDPTVPTHKADSFVPISYEALGDMADVTSELRKLFMDAKAQHEAPAFVTGTGAGQPTGVVSGLTATETVDTAGVGVFAADDVYALIEALPARFRINARWLASLPVINDIDRFETGNGAKLFPRVGDANPVLLRKPLHEHSELDDTVTAGNNILLGGDFSKYVLVDRAPAAIELIPNLFGANRRPTGQRGFYLWWRVGGAPVVTNAFRRLQVAAA